MDVRVLIVDDHPPMCEALRFVFAAAGIQRCDEATTCQEAIRALRHGNFDVVLLDVSLRDGNGLDALQQIKATDASLPVLVHSYHDNPRLISRSFQLGASGYVLKGLDKNLLIQAVRQAAMGASVWTAEQMSLVREVADEVSEFGPAAATRAGRTRIG